MLYPKPMIPTIIQGVVLAVITIIKNNTSPAPIIRNKVPFFTLPESHTVDKRPARIIIHNTLAVIWERVPVIKPVSLK